jgi:hypothetical protein
MDIEPRMLAELAKIHCTTKEAASVLGMGVRTFMLRMKEPQYRDIWNFGKDIGKVSLRRTQWRHANGIGSGAVNMSIHLGKHWLGQTDKAAIEMSGPGGGPIQVVLSKDDTGLL